MAEARALSAEDRAKLAEAMLESLHPFIPEVNAAGEEEIQRRVESFDRGLMPTYQADSVFAEARQILE
jgi:hypothetical protein